MESLSCYYFKVSIDNKYLNDLYLYYRYIYTYIYTYIVDIYIIDSHASHIPSKLIELMPYIQMLQFQSRQMFDKWVYFTEFSALENVI